MTQHTVSSSADRQLRPVRRLSTNRRRSQQRHGQQTRRTDEHLPTQVRHNLLVTHADGSRASKAIIRVCVTLCVCLTSLVPPSLPVMSPAPLYLRTL